MVTDPVADFLVRLRNASMVRRERILVPASKMKRALAAILSREGYIGEFRTKSSGALEVDLRYSANGLPAITGAKRVSKPSQRMYIGSRDIRAVKRGRGLLVLSTPLGILSGKEARQKKVGGEALFEIW